jgi:membrane-bound serine protease (ClpP class)
MVDWKWGLSGTLAAVVLVPIIVYFGFQIMPSTPFGRKMLFGESGEHEPVLKTDGVDECAALVGMEGDALTDLRPVGVARIGKERLDVLSEVSYVRAGSRVRVTAVEGTTVKVRPVV